VKPGEGLVPPQENIMNFIGKVCCNTYTAQLIYRRFRNRVDAVLRRQTHTHIGNDSNRPHLMNNNKSVAALLKCYWNVVIINTLHYSTTTNKSNNLRKCKQIRSDWLSHCAAIKNIDVVYCRRLHTLCPTKRIPDVFSLTQNASLDFKGFLRLQKV